MESFLIGMISLGCVVAVVLIWVWFRGMRARKNVRMEQDAMFVKIQNTCPCRLLTEKTDWCELTRKACAKKNCMAHFIIKFRWPTHLPAPIEHEKLRRDTTN
jgi:hypothetical protein